MSYIIIDLFAFVCLFVCFMLFALVFSGASVLIHFQDQCLYFKFFGRIIKVVG